MCRTLDVVLSISLLLCLTSVACETISITIPCNGTTTADNSELNGQFITLEPSSTLTVQCVEIDQKISFIIFQVHTYRYNITLYKGSIAPNTSYVGTNVGIYSSNAGNPVHRFSIDNYNDVTVKMYVSIHGYDEAAPIPGGCNLVAPVEVDPTLSLRLTNSLIRVSAAPAKIDYTRKCGDEFNLKIPISITHLFYRLYLPERDFSEDVYFDAVKKMITKKSVETYGEELSPAWWRNYLLRLFSRYPGTGSVYVVVVTSTFGSAVYVPTHTYGCTLAESEDNCSVFSDVFSQVIFAVMFFTGLFMCYYGHRFYKTEMFLMGLLAGAIVTYIVISQHTKLDPPVMLTAALITGVFTGAIWWLLWWFYGSPVLSVLLPTMLLGFLSACGLMFIIPDGSETLSFDSNFWCIFFIVMLLVPVPLLWTTLEANILCCSVLGAYAAVYSIDHYLGSNLKYAVINVVRRAVDPGFQNVYLATPFQWRDILLVLLFVMLSLTGFLFQKYHNSGRAPFPPPPRNTMPSGARAIRPSIYEQEEEIRPRSGRRMSRRIINERSPLLN